MSSRNVFFCFGHIILQEYSIDLHKKCPIVLRPSRIRGVVRLPIPFHAVYIPLCCPFMPRLSLYPQSQGQKTTWEMRGGQFSTNQATGRAVSIKWYVLIPQITDTCSPLPSHPVASPLHHLMQCNHLHYLMKPYCTHPTPLPAQTHVYTVEPRSKLYNKYTKA